MKNLLLLSSSKAGNTPYLEHALPMIKNHLNAVKTVLFIPYAGVNMTYDEYTTRVQTALSSIDVAVEGIHTTADPIAAVQQAEAILVGGGNTFHLLHQLYATNIIETLKQVVANGTPYIGWSAGSNIAGLSIKTTNDMPIIEPKSFEALSLVNFQLNPHYTDYVAPNHNGETRDQRLGEFMMIEPNTNIVGIMEGSALQLKDNKLSLLGLNPAYVFNDGRKTKIDVNADLTDLL